MRDQLTKVPRFCVVGMAQGSPAQADPWQQYDCLLSVNGNEHAHPALLWQALIKLPLTNGGEIGVWNEGQTRSMRVSGNLNGANLKFVGYSGEFSLMVNAVKPGSWADKAGIQQQDLLLKANDILLTHPSILHSDAFKNSDNVVWVFRPEHRGPNESASDEVIEALGNHPIAYWPGELLRFELPAGTSPIGIHVQPFVTMANKNLSGADD